MFPDHVYIQRRKTLKRQFSDGILLFLGNAESPSNCADNFYSFRQDSTFLYYWGVDQPDLVALIDLDEERDIVFGDDHPLETTIWEGAQPTLNERGQQAGIEDVKPSARLAIYLAKTHRQGRQIRILPPYRPEHRLFYQQLPGMAAKEVTRSISVAFIQAVVAQRSIKSDAEIREIEQALAVTAEMHALAMSRTRIGAVERDLVAAMQALVYARTGKPLAFAPIFTMRGEILHNRHHDNPLAAGKLVVNDSGTQSALFYASDITRTFPVSGRFSSRQREIYDIVLAAQAKAIEMMAPGVAYRDVHLAACRHIVTDLKALGLMRGDTDVAVAAGAHALFMPHGLGHMLGLDVHDMDALGEDYVGYVADQPRSTQFGLNSLRLARSLEKGFVVTVEPGIYFIPALIDRWQSEHRFTDFIAYDRLKTYRDFGGIRIEDDVLVTDGGATILGPGIPKSIEDVEATTG